MALPEFSLRQLLEAGVHFGHQTHRWNPKMSSYIYGSRNGIHILDLTQTVPLLDAAILEGRLGIVVIILRKILEQPPRQDRKIAGCHVMFRVRPTGGVPELAVVQAQFLRLGVHELCKSVFASSQALCDHDAGVVARLNDDSANEVF